MFLSTKNDSQILNDPMRISSQDFQIKDVHKFRDHSFNTKVSKFFNLNFFSNTYLILELIIIRTMFRQFSLL